MAKDDDNRFIGTDEEFDVVVVKSPVEKAKKKRASIEPNWDKHDELIEAAKPVMDKAYKKHGQRIIAVIKSTDSNDPDVPADFWTQEAGRLTQAILPLYDETVREAVLSGSSQISVSLNWDQVNQAVLALAHQKAETFAEYAVDSSKAQTAQIIEDWIKSGGTMAELISRVEQVWEGPRPDTAAVTEVTNLFAEGNRLAWQKSTVVSGYKFHTAEDDHVCPLCDGIDGQVFELGDTEHLPAIHGGCRCGISPVVKSADEIFGGDDGEE